LLLLLLLGVHFGQSYSVLRLVKLFEPSFARVK
jgi:hypothetical protein